MTWAFVANAGAQSLTLEEALKTAQTHRPSIQSARLEIERARSEAKAIGAYPPLTFGIGWSSAANVGATDQDLFVSQSLDFWGRVPAAQKLGEGGIRLAETSYRQALLTTQTEVLKAYFETVAAQRLSSVADDLVSVAESLQKATSRRFEEGKVPEVQVTRSSIESDRARQAAILRKSQFEASLKRLSGVLGIAEAPTSVKSVGLPEPQFRLDQRPDLAGIRSQIQIAESERLVAERSNKPEFEIAALRSPWQGQPTATGIRLQLTWRAGDHGKAKNEQRMATQKAEALNASLSDLTKKALAEIAAIDIEIKAAEKRLTSFQEIRNAAADLVEKSRRGYSEGFGTLLDVLEATRSLREIEQEMVEAQLAVNLARVAKYEVGGSLIEVAK